MWMEWRRKVKFTGCWNLRAFQILHLLEREMISVITRASCIHSEMRSGHASQGLPLTQYRMSLDVIARHLVLFKSSKEFVSAIADAMAGSTLFVESDHITNLSLPQHINMPISMLMSSIVTSVR